MRYLFFTFVFGIALTGETLATEQSMLARITVYWKGESGARASWNGARLQTGHCAVDPKRIPYGSKVIFPDAACLAVDTGTDVVNRKAARVCGQTTAQKNAIVIDRYFESRTEAISWAKRNPHFMTVRIQQPESRKRKVAEATNNIAPTAPGVPFLALQAPEKVWPSSLGVDWTQRLLSWGLETCFLFPTSG